MDRSIGFSQHQVKLLKVRLPRLSFSSVLRESFFTALYGTRNIFSGLQRDFWEGILGMLFVSADGHESIGDLSDGLLGEPQESHRIFDR